MFIATSGISFFTIMIRHGVRPVRTDRSTRPAHVVRAAGSMRPAPHPPAHHCSLPPASSSTSPSTEREAYACTCSPIHLVSSAGRGGLRHNSFPPGRL